jgi:hypothetical protein
MPNLPYKTAGWDTHSQVRLREIAYPLAEQEPTHYTVRRFFEGPSSTFGGIASLDTADAEFAAAKLVANGNQTDIDGGCIAYERLFATVPASWSEPEEYAFTYPAYLGSGGYVGYSVSAITASGANFILSISGSTIVAGDTVFYSLKFTRNSIVYNVSGSAIAVATTNTSQVTITIGLAGTGVFSSVSGSVGLTIPKRENPETKIVGSRVQSDYILSSPANLNTDLPLIPVFSAIVTSGGTFGTLTDTLSTATAPTAAQYIALINAGSEIVAECTRRRYLGNIYVRRTRFVPAL